MSQKAIVIGAGITGLAVALRLRRMGCDVTVFETNARPGGKISEFHKQGFRFDMGPTLFTFPSLMDSLYEDLGYDRSNFLSYSRLPEITRYFYEDKTCIKARRTPEEFAAEISRKTGDDEEAVARYLQDSSELYELTSDPFLFSDFSWSTLRKKTFWKAAANIHKLNVNKTLHSVNTSYFTDPKTVQLFDRYATYMGSNPYRAPGTLSVIPHLEHNMGAYYPSGGMYQIILSLYDLAQKVGIDFKFSDEVKRLEHHNGNISRVISESGSYSTDIVVSAIDHGKLYDSLLPELAQRRQAETERLSSSALIFYWGVRGNHDKLGMHNILFSGDYRQEFKNIFDHNTISPDPTVYVYISSKIQTEDAPEDAENWYVMVNAPTEDEQHWPDLIQAAKNNILRKINRITDIDLKEKIIMEEQWDPRGIQRDTGSWKGALYGESFNSPWSVFRRHSNKSPDLENLYLAGGSVHPGGGIPLCLASAQIVESLIIKDWNLKI